MLFWLSWSYVEEAASSTKLLIIHGLVLFFDKVYRTKLTNYSFWSYLAEADRTNLYFFLFWSYQISVLVLLMYILFLPDAIFSYLMPAGNPCGCRIGLKPCFPKVESYIPSESRTQLMVLAG